jgi:hypothetical protein
MTQIGYERVTRLNNNRMPKIHTESPSSWFVYLITKLCFDGLSVYFLFTSQHNGIHKFKIYLAFFREKLNHKKKYILV